MGTGPQQLSTCSVLQPADRCCSVLASLADTGCPQFQSKLQVIVSFISFFSKRKQHTGAVLLAALEIVCKAGFQMSFFKLHDQ